MTGARIDFAGINAVALARFDECMALLGLAGGKRNGPEYLPLNPRRADHRPGSFSINRQSGMWGDFAADASGRDLIALAAYVWNIGQGEAARRLADGLGIAAGGPGSDRGRG